MNYSEDHKILRDLSAKLGLRNELETAKVLSRVLHAIRDQLPEPETNELLDKLPCNLVTILLSAWRRHHKYQMTKHLDEFVNRVISCDKSKPDRVFRTEIEALRATLITLDELEKRYHLLSCFSDCLRQEIRIALAEAA